MAKRPVTLLADGVYDHAGAAEYLKISASYLYQLRHTERGPAAEKKGRTLYYTKAALDAWDTQRKKRAAERAAKRAQKKARTTRKAA